MIKCAAAKVNHDLGLFKVKQAGDRVVASDAIAQMIMRAADEVLAGLVVGRQFVVDLFQAGAGTRHNTLEPFIPTIM